MHFDAVLIVAFLLILKIELSVDKIPKIPPIKDKEVELVLLTSQLQMAGWQVAHVADLLAKGETLRWEVAHRYAVSQRVFPLVLKNLQTHFSEYLPDEYLIKWRQEQEARAAKSLAMFSRLLSCLQLLADHEIVAVPFKGPGFTLSVYGDPALRDYCDLDILIFTSELARTVELLQNYEYTPVFYLGGKQLLSLSKYDNEFCLIHSDGTNLDLQWELTGGYFHKKITLEKLEDRLLDATWFGRDVLQFGNEDMIVYLAIHGSQHLWRQLDNVCCLSELINKTEISGVPINWDLVLEISKSLECSRMVKVALLLCNKLKLLNNVLPKEIETYLQSDPLASQLSDIFTNSLLVVGSWESLSQTSRRFNTLQLAMLEGAYAKFRYGLHLLFSPTRHDFRKKKLPQYLTPLYYITRPARLLGEYFGK